MSYRSQPYVLTNTNSPAFWLIGIVWMPLATGMQTGNNFSLLEQRMHNGSGPPSHAHTQSEGFYVLDGACTFNAGGVSVQAGAGTFISVPADTPHSFTVDQDPSHVLNFYIPAGFEMILMSIAMPAQERSIPAPDAVALPPPWLIEELSREYGQTKVLGLPFLDAPGAHNMSTTPSKTNPLKPFGMRNVDAPAYWQSDILWSMLATGEQTGGAYSAMEELCPQHSGAPPHYHEQDEMFYVLEGEATFVADAQQFRVGSGAFVYIPAGSVHSFRVDSDVARLLNFYTPAGFEEVITATGQPAQGYTLPPANLAPLQDDPEYMEALFKRVGMHVVAVPDFLRG